MKINSATAPTQRIHLSPGVESPEEQVGYEYDRHMHQFRSQFHGKRSREEIEDLVDDFERDLFLKHPEYPGNKFVKMTQACREAVRPRPSRAEKDLPK